VHQFNQGREVLTLRPTKAVIKKILQPTSNSLLNIKIARTVGEELCLPTYARESVETKVTVPVAVWVTC
jgi:hypothetical protein